MKPIALAIILTVIIRALLLSLDASAQSTDTIVTLQPGGAIVVTCTGTIGGTQVDSRTLRITCPTTTGTPVPPTATSAVPTVTPTPVGTGTPATSMQVWHAPGQHDALNRHEHGDSPQDFFQQWSQLELGKGITYGGDEASSPTENVMKHQAFKGIRAKSDAGGDVYLRYHAASNPMDRSAQFHSYEVYYRDVAGNVSFWQGWYDTGDPTTDARCPRRTPSLPCEDQRPIILVVDQAAWNANIRGEQWYMFGSPESGLSWDMGLTILNATTQYKTTENATAMDVASWTLTGDKGLQRRSDGFWYLGRGGGGTDLTGWFCAEYLGDVVTVGSKNCPSGSLPQYIAPTLGADARPDGFGNTRIGWLIQKSFPGTGVTVPN